ncbi:hypothetical protein GGX14DRAFT_562364 [Mycena pura]|uniref:Uncharacterized protein n=1 Tax=Mycena pura TaxID=153505 RepID=A0AAD6VKP3_9AGAR|nr:hypothetical protein GGX14DRAFT_562364 [Mycena pura]
MDHIDYSRPIGGRVAVRMASEGETPTPDSMDPAPAGPDMSEFMPVDASSA